ncbi:MAG: SLC13 family permease [Acidobacteriota bacterium]
MTIDIAILLLIIGFTLAAFVREWMPLDLVALSCLGLLLLFDLVTPAQAVAGFGNEAVITVMMMFVLSDGLVRSGLINRAAYRFAAVSEHSHWPSTILLMLLTAVMSAFINNVAALTIFMPVALHLANHHRVSPSRLLLPLSYASIFGGTCTLVGTSTNLLISSLAHEQGFPPFTMFEFLPLGLILFAIGLLYTIALPMRRLPPRVPITELTRRYGLASYLTEVKVPKGSDLLGQTVIDAQISERFQLNVLMILRGKQRISIDLRSTLIAPDDVLILRGAVDDIQSFQQVYDLLLLPDYKVREHAIGEGDNVLTEIQLAPNTRLTGRTLKDIDFRKTYGAFVLAVARTGDMIHDKVAYIELQQFDTLLVFGPRAKVEALQELDDFLPIGSLVEQAARVIEARQHAAEHDADDDEDENGAPASGALAPRWWISATILPIVMLLAAFGIMPIVKASMLGAVAMLVSGVLTMQQAYRAINWTVIFLVAAILPLGTAMLNTGLAGVIGQSLADWGAEMGPYGVLAMLYLGTTLFTELMSNNSTAVIMVPIAVQTAALMHLDGRTFLMAVTFAASASFLTPMGYKTNAMVYGPGGYRFVDYIRAGLPLKIVFWIVSIVLIPMIWPLTPV